MRVILQLAIALTVVRAQVQTPLTEDDISVILSVVEDGANTPVTSLPLGAAAQLRLELVNNNFQETTSVAGALVRSCEVGKDAAFTTSFTILDNGCFVDNALFEFLPTTVGFSRDAASGTVLPVKTYLAKSLAFEIAAFNQETLGPSALYFRCSLTFCFDDTDPSTPCGGNHCVSARKRRSVAEGRSTVYTNITVIHNTEKNCERCSDSSMFRVTVGVMSFITSTLFVAMFLVYNQVSRDLSRHKQECMRKSSDMSTCQKADVIITSALQTDDTYG